MTTLTLYNTLTRTKEAFTPIDANNVRMYVCGPTVYDFAHIGNARPVIVFDVLFRLLRHVYGADHVTYVRNITDVDDKINARALRDFPDLPLNDAIRKVTEKTETQFLADAKALGCLEPTSQPRATDNIAQMVVLIQKLLDNGNAYVVRGPEGRETLFDVKSMGKEYGALSRRDGAANVAGARIEVKDHKRNPEDFVLWKESASDEPGWDALFVLSNENRTELNLNDNQITIRGRPGWHIECSAMSERFLWEEIQDRLSPEAHQHPHTFDIHGGGLDLIFPHHENEIAQSRCAHGTHAMANVWMHNGFLQVEGQKMSKSLGNFVTINELLEKGWDGRVARLLMLKTHYRKPIDWTRGGLMAAGMELQKFVYLAKGDIPPSEMRFSSLFWEAISDDLNTSGALAALHALLGEIYMARSLEDGPRQSELSLQIRSGLTLLGLGDLTGYDFNQMVAATRGTSMEQIENKFAQQVADRLAALNAKDFAKADAIRADLANQGITLMDYKDEAGERQTKWEIKR